MEQYQENQQQYAKWTGYIWNTIEQEISIFQKKVTDAMIQLGDININNEQQFKSSPLLKTQVILGEQFYIDQIRPIYVQKGYLPKIIPKLQDFQDSKYNSDSDQQIQEKMIEKKQQKKIIKIQQKPIKKGNKKGSKNNKGKGNDQKMKIQISKQNLKKDINMILASYSIQKMQFQFGLKQQKIELKLMTFFYITYYIKKNKINQKIEQSTIFQLINILIKIIRVFNNIKGPSFINHNQQIQISSTLILDLRACTQGLKQYYKYQNKTLIIKYPKLVYYTQYDKYFQSLDIKPYKSQIQLIKNVKNAFNQNGNNCYPLLILYKSMIGSGKTTASLALSQLVKRIKQLNQFQDEQNKKLQLVYCCVIGAVRAQVGRYAYNQQVDFALGAMCPLISNQKLFYPRIINSWSCRNKKTVDLLISDAYCTYNMLDKRHLTQDEQKNLQLQIKMRKKQLIYGKIDPENTILFIDQPTAFCKSTNSITTRRIFNILSHYPPKITILSSATIPNANRLQKTIQLIKRRNSNLKVIQIDSKEFQIGCQYCSFKGQVIFPHTGVKNKKQLNQIIQLLSKNGFLLRLYTGPSLFFLIRKCQKVGLKNILKINDLLEVKQEDIINAIFKILKTLSTRQDQIIEQVCSTHGDEFNLDFKEDILKSDDEDLFSREQQQQAQQKDYINFKKMLKSDAYKFLGGCLIGTAQPITFAYAMFSKWVQDIRPIEKLLEKYNREIEALNTYIKKIENDKQIRQDRKSQMISKLIIEHQVTLDFPQIKKINSLQHYQKYCKQKHSSHYSMLIKPIQATNIGVQLIDQVDDFLLKLLFCGVAVYAKKGINKKYLNKVQELASANYLAYIITDQSLCYGTNFPISNVILRDDLVQTLSMNDVFQLIGRAGRVGQSWTARAFLQDYGLKMLHNYIHKNQSQNNVQAQIFQMIAEQHLDYPLLKLRTLKTEIRYRDYIENSQKVQILIKKKLEQQSIILKNICIISYLYNQKNTNLSILSKKQKIEGINYYNFPFSQILYQDLPTIKNSKQEDIIDVAYYYKDQMKFISNTINNALKRIIKYNLNSQISISNQINKFQINKYKQDLFLDKETNTYVFLIHQNKQIQQLDIKQYKYQKLVGNKIQKLDDIILNRLKCVLQESKRLSDKIRQNPRVLNEYQIKYFIQAHRQLMQKDSSKFYKAFFNQYFSKGQKQYFQIIKQKNLEKNIEQIQFSQQSKIILTISLCDDLKNFQKRNFHIFKEIRSIWNYLEKFILEQNEK